MPNIPWMDAIIKVLSDPIEPMHYSDIAEQIVERGLRESIGATPANTVNAYISTSIREEGEESPFIKLAKGTYCLKKIDSDEGQKNSAPCVEDTNSEINDNGEPSIINAFGMFWRRDSVLWTAQPNILGRQQIGADSVNFCDQVGVYLLHDGKDTVYVGRAVERPLGKRLYEHTKDRLNGRWDRFSWFGLLPVSDEGKLDNVTAIDFSTNIIISTLEALLIEGLEPPQNRKRGDDFNANEYLQAIDPEIEKKKEKTLLSQMLERIGQG